MINFNPKLTPLTRKLRNNSTQGEIILWTKALRAKQMSGYQFNRQLAMNIDNNNIIVDFICRKLKFIIEIDGYSYNFKYQEDGNRDTLLLKHGYEVLRISEKEVIHDLENVIRKIECKIQSLEQNPPNPLLKKGEQQPQKTMYNE